MKIKVTLLLCLVFLVTACGPSVTTTKKNNADLSDYESFAYLPNSNFDDLSKFETDNKVGLSIINSVNEKMKDLGYALDRSNPDLLVILSTNTDSEKTVSKDPVYATYPAYYNTRYSVSPYYQNNYYYGYNTYTDVVGYNTDVDTYQEGTLILHLVDSETKNVVWKGQASDAIFQQNETQAIAGFVDDMFQELKEIQ